jgi:hypothetical protein
MKNWDHYMGATIGIFNNTFLKDNKLIENEEMVNPFQI